MQRAGDNTLTLYRSRLLFDNLLTKYGDLYELTQLKDNSELVTNPDFENGIIKIQKELSDRNRLTLREKNAVSRYLKTNADAADGQEEKEKEEVEELGFADTIIAEAEREHKRRRVVAVADDRCVSTIHVLSQSNLCERLFSLAKLVMTDRRQSMRPSTLNNLLILKLNHKFWTVSDIHNLLNTIAEEGEPDIEMSDDEEDKDESEDEEDEDEAI